MEGAALQQQPASGKLDQLATEAIPDSPDFLVGDHLRIGQALPELRGVGIGEPVHLGLGGIEFVEFLLPDLANSSLHPTDQMDAIGDMPDRYLVRILGSVEFHPHFAAHSPMQFAHTVGGPGILQGQNGHAERLGCVVGDHAAEIHQRLVVDVQV